MTSKAIRQLQYVSRTLTFDSIAEETGMSPVSLIFAAEGLAEVPIEGRTLLNNLYSRTAYANLKAAGMSATQANRFRTYSAETVSTLETEMQLMVFEYSMGVLAKKTESLTGEQSWETMTELWEESVDAVTEGFQNSKKSFEDWQNY